MTDPDTAAPRHTSAQGRGAIAAAVACAIGGLAVVGYWMTTVNPHSTSVSGGEALIFVFLFFALVAVAAASALAAALGAVAGSVAGRTGNPWMGMLSGLGMGVVGGLLVLLTLVGAGGLRDALPQVLQQFAVVAAALGVPAAIGGFLALRRPSAPPPRRLPRVAPQVQAATSKAVAAAGAVQRVAVPVATALQQRLPGELRAPDARNALARWPLLLLLFVALAMFTVFVLLAAPDLAPWAGTDYWLAQAINAGAMPWSKAVTAWVLRSQGAADPFVAALLVGLGLGFNGALLAGLLAGLRRTVPVR